MADEMKPRTLMMAYSKAQYAGPEPHNKMAAYWRGYLRAAVKGMGAFSKALRKGLNK
jgi:hypothetical protein